MKLEMDIQISLTVSESKRLIAEAIVQMPEVKDAFKNGKILLKGGTSVSAVCEKLLGSPLRISGRITERGTLTAKVKNDEYPHSALIENKTLINIDNNICEIVDGLIRTDVIVISGNAMDIHGNVAMMAGSPGGGTPGHAVPGMMAQGAHVIIPMGLEKLIPGSIHEAVQAAGREIDLSYGMAVGLIPLVGRVVTEKDAVEILAPVSCTVIGRGGIQGGEGSTVMAVKGDNKSIETIIALIDKVKGSKTSGEPGSLVSCDGPSDQCKKHRACIYKKSIKGGVSDIRKRK